MNKEIFFAVKNKLIQMNRPENKQIFFDKTRRRGRYLKLVLILIILIVFICFGLTLNSIFSWPDEILGLISPALGIGNTLPTFLPNGYASSSEINSGSSVDFSVDNFYHRGETRKKYESLAYFVNWDDDSFVSLTKNIDKIDGLIPEWLHLGPEGKIFPDDPAVQKTVLEYIRKNRPNLPVYALVNNYDSQSETWDGLRLSKMLDSQDLRSANIEDLLNFVKNNKLAGVSIDYENVDPLKQYLLTLYFKELYLKFHSQGLIVSINIPLADTDFRAEVLQAFCDWIILMSYDEFTPLAGPIASENWYLENIKKRLAAVSGEKYIISLGNYGYDWPESGASETISFAEAMDRAEKAGAKVNFDRLSFNPTFVYPKDGINHRVWYLDGPTFFNQASEALNLGRFGGVALWRMGSEDPSLWNFFGRTDIFDKKTAEVLKNFNSGYSVQYSGKGEIFKLTETPKIGERDIFFDENRKIILEETISKYPSGFKIEKTGGEDPKKIALTFDDGPSQYYTSEILEILKKHQIKGSFFVIGINANEYPDILKKIYREGHEIGIHTFTHPELSSVSSTQLKLEISATERLIESLIGAKTKLFRPPYAEKIEPVRPSDTGPLLESSSFGFLTVGMGINPQDWQNISAGTIAENTLKAVRENQGNIILLHDGGGDRSETVKALPVIIDTLKQEGYQFVPLSELLNAKDKPVLAELPESEKNLSRVNAVSFFLLSLALRVMKFLFYSGVVLASARIVCLVVLAEIGIRKSRMSALSRRFLRPNFSVSVIIPAYNEARVITKTIHSMLSSVENHFDIIVVNDGSEDNTAEVIRQEFSGHPKVKLFNLERSGKAEALNFGIQKTRADIVITIDADTVFRRDTIKRLVSRFSDPAVGAVAGNVYVGNQINLLTRWQALEYITSQNFERRALEVVNAITVVPGSVGAWKRKAIIAAGGFSGSTLAEDADLTMAVIRKGYKVVYEENAVAFTESPDTIRAFLKQRFRWMYGMLQAAWKNLDLIFKGKLNGLSLAAIPNIIIFQVLFSLISPIMDLALILSVIWAIWQNKFHPNDFSSIFSFGQIILYYIYFSLIDFLVALVAFLLEKNKKWSLLPLLPLQRFFYRQLLYITAIRSLTAAISGRLVRWGKVERKNTVKKNVQPAYSYD